MTPSQRRKFTACWRFFSIVTTLVCRYYSATRKDLNIEVFLHPRYKFENTFLTGVPRSFRKKSWQEKKSSSAIAVVTHVSSNETNVDIEIRAPKSMITKDTLTDVLVQTLRSEKQYIIVSRRNGFKSRNRWIKKFNESLPTTYQLSFDVSIEKNMSQSYFIKSTTTFPRRFENFTISFYCR